MQILNHIVLVAYFLMHHRLLFSQNFLKKIIRFFPAVSEAKVVVVRRHGQQLCPGRLVWYLEVEIKIIYDRFVSGQELEGQQTADH